MIYDIHSVLNLMEFHGRRERRQSRMTKMPHILIAQVFLVAQLVKNLPAVWETGVWSLGWEDPLEKGKATHSSMLAWRIP